MRRMGCRIGAGEVSFYTRARAAARHGRSSGSASLQCTRGMGKGVGRWAVSWRSSKTWWLIKAWARTVGRVA